MALLKTHSEGLVAVRNYSSSYQGFVLDVYVYLRDKIKTEFMTPKVQEGIYRMYVDVFAQIRGGGAEHPPGHQSAGGATSYPATGATNQTSASAQKPCDNPQCSHCTGTKTVHMGGKSQRPFRELAAEKARAATKDVHEAVSNGSDKDLATLISGALSKHK
ncbi:hypothetical protein ACA910_013183 [Epithemia clementina (nom. ined.)]